MTLHVTRAKKTCFVLKKISFLFFVEKSSVRKSACHRGQVRPTRNQLTLFRLQTNACLSLSLCLSLYMFNLTLTHISVLQMSVRLSLYLSFLSACQSDSLSVVLCLSVIQVWYIEFMNTFTNLNKSTKFPNFETNPFTKQQQQ